MPNEQDSERPEGPLNHHEEFAQYLQTLPPVYGRKLLFSEQCGLAYVLKKGERHDVVMDAFNLSAATVSQLARCLQPHGKAYRDVWQEFQTRGEDNFRDVYYSEELHYRLKRVRLGLTHLAPDSDDIAPKQTGPDPRAAKYAFENFGPITIDGDEWRIDLSPIPDWPPGWYFGPCDGKERTDLASVYYGEERVHGRDGHEPFSSSSLAFDGIYSINGYDSPRPKPGRKLRLDEPNRRADKGADQVFIVNGKPAIVGWKG